MQRRISVRRTTASYRATALPEPSPDTVEAIARQAAVDAGLRYVRDDRPGITRERVGKRFRYRKPDGSILRGDDLARVRALAVPPAYTEVWICPDARGHIQATGRDARGRKQYRYHAKWRATRDATKYDRLLAFGRALPALRRRVAVDLRRADTLERDAVLALVVWLLDRTLIRVGNEEYARTNQSYGLTTLRSRHVAIRGGKVRFSFRGKSGVDHEVTIEDRRIARALQRCAELPGQELFQYIAEDGSRQVVDSGDVNQYLREATGANYTAKDYRTWAGSVMALAALSAYPFASARQGKQQLVTIVRAVATELRNTPAVCRKCYVHPAIVESYTAGALDGLVRARGGRHMTPYEATLLAFLRKEQRRGAQSKGR